MNADEELPTVTISEHAETYVSEIVVSGADDDNEVAISIGIADDGTELIMLSSPAGSDPLEDPFAVHLTVPANALLRAIEVLRTGS